MRQQRKRPRLEMSNCLSNSQFIALPTFSLGFSVFLIVAEEWLDAAKKLTLALDPFFSNPITHYLFWKMRPGRDGHVSKAPSYSTSDYCQATFPNFSKRE